MEQIGQRNPPAAARALPATRNPQLAAVFTVEHWRHEVVTSHSLYKVCNKKTRYEGGRELYKILCQLHRVTLLLAETESVTNVLRKFQVKLEPKTPNLIPQIPIP